MERAAMNRTLDGRQALVGIPTAAAIATLGVSSTVSASTISSSFGNHPWTTESLKYYESFRQSIRLQRCLIEDADVLHWYHS